MLAMKSCNWGRGGDTLRVSEPPCPFKVLKPQSLCRLLWKPDHYTQSNTCHDSVNPSQMHIRQHPEVCRSRPFLRGQSKVPHKRIRGKKGWRIFKKSRDLAALESSSSSEPLGLDKAGWGGRLTRNKADRRPPLARPSGAQPSLPPLAARADTAASRDSEGWGRQGHDPHSPPWAPRRTYATLPHSPAPSVSGH